MNSVPLPVSDPVSESSPVSDTLPLFDSRRPALRIRPLKAWHHFRKLIANKEDTEQVFHIIQALNDSRIRKKAAQFFATPVGRKSLAKKEYLPDLLDDHDRLRELAADTVGRAYLQFMEREGLTAAGLVAEHDKFTRGKKFDDLVEHYGNRLRDTHDLSHVLTGYGRDALGEQCVLAFSYSLNPNWGGLFIAWAGAREMKKKIKTNTPIYAAVREAQRIGRSAHNIAYQDIPALLAEPLAEARKRLSISAPILYQQAHVMMREQGIDPYNLLDNQITAQTAQA